MDTQVPEKPRKKPQQRRSKATVDALLEATAQILVSHGYQKASTNRIAERAGVSIGSLYEYFPNKDALVTALIERNTYDVLHSLMLTMEQSMKKEPEEAVRFWIAQMVAVLNEKADVVRASMNQIPYMMEIPAIKQLRSKLMALAAYGGGHLAQNYDKELTPEEIYLITTMVSTSIIAMVVEPPQDVDSTVESLASMMLRMLSQ